YGLNEAKKAPPPPPTPIPDERPKALEEVPTTPESGKLPDGGTRDDKKETPKEISEVPTPEVKADVQVDLNKNQNLGASDLTKP
ncbi:MAG: cytochrome bc complex cytochrome b subunit, partial [Nitrosopumilaceae archaeon]